MTLRVLAPLLLSLAAGCGGHGLPAGDGATPADAAAPVDEAQPIPDLAVAPDLAALIICGGFAGRPCPAGMFCETRPGECCCDFQGVCRPIPGACTKQYQPVCGCDKKTYGNDCERQAAGVSPDHDGVCSFPCGNKLSCRVDQICFQGCCGAAGCMPPPPTCQDAPPACNGHPSCACVGKSPLDRCQDLPGGGVRIDQFGCP